MNTENMIEVTGVNLVLMVQAVYDLSVPQGMGHLHHETGPLSDEDAQALIGAHADSLDNTVVHMDYVKGRCCKFWVHQDPETEKLYIEKSWYDHTPSDLELLLERCGIGSKEGVDKEPEAEPRIKVIVLTTEQSGVIKKIQSNGYSNGLTTLLIFRTLSRFLSEDENRGAMNVKAQNFLVEVHVSEDRPKKPPVAGVGEWIIPNSHIEAVIQLLKDAEKERNEFLAFSAVARALEAAEVTPEPGKIYGFRMQGETLFLQDESLSEDPAPCDCPSCTARRNMKAGGLDEMLASALNGRSSGMDTGKSSH